jgi:hypothetical protein
MTPHQQARTDGKYLFVWDKNGQTTTFYQYMERMTRVDNVMRRIKESGETEKEFKAVRSDLIKSMNKGNVHAFDLEEEIVNFDEFSHAQLLPMNQILSVDQWKAGWSAALEAGEELAGHEQCNLQSKFVIAVVSKAKNEETLIE